MGINIKGEKVKLWIDEREGKDGNKWRQYRVGIGAKYDDKWVNSYMKVRFKKDINVENVPNGTEFNFEGFLTIEKPWTNKDGKEVKEPMIIIMSADFGEFGDTGFAEVTEPLPF